MQLFFLPPPSGGTFSFWLQVLFCRTRFAVATKLYLSPDLHLTDKQLHLFQLNSKKIPFFVCLPFVAMIHHKEPLISRLVSWGALRWPFMVESVRVDCGLINVWAEPAGVRFYKSDSFVHTFTFRKDLTHYFTNETSQKAFELHDGNKTLTVPLADYHWMKQLLMCPFYTPTVLPPATWFCVKHWNVTVYLPQRNHCYMAHIETEMEISHFIAVTNDSSSLERCQCRASSVLIKSSYNLLPYICFPFFQSNQTQKQLGSQSSCGRNFWFWYDMVTPNPSHFTCGRSLGVWSCR